MTIEEGQLESEVTGEVISDDGVLVLTRIHVEYRLAVDPEHHGTAERVHGFHARSCPVARSIEAAIEISTALRFV